MPRPVKFIDLAERLREQIEAGHYQPNTPLPTEQELADQFEVSRLTLRKALDVLASQAVVVRRAGVGTFVNGGASRTLPTVLYVGETQTHFHQEFYAALCGEAQDRHRAVATFLPTAGDPQSLATFRKLATRHRRLICVENAWRLIAPVVPEDVHVTRVSGFLSIPRVETGERPGYLISTDNYRGAKLAVEHLIGLGHRHVGFVNYGWRVPNQPFIGIVDPHQDAYLGYRAALNESGIADLCPLGVPDNPAIEDFQIWQHQCLAEQLARLERRPTAFLCVGDFRAAPLLRLLRELGLRIPHDASVVGMGNTPWAQAVDPQLTSVCMGETQMARLALLLNEEPEPDTARIVRVDPELILRQSTGLVPAAAKTEPADRQPSSRAPSTGS